MNKIRIIIFDKEDITKTLVESYLKEVTFPFVFEKYNEFNTEQVKSIQETKIIIVDINRTNPADLKKIAVFSKNSKNNFLVISNEKSTNLSVQALRAGAKDFLQKPLSQSNFLTAIKKIYNNCVVKQKKKSESKVYTVSSYEKGVGKTVFLINLAKEIADYTKEKVLLIDFNNSLNDISFLLNVDIISNTAHYINNLTEENKDKELSRIPKYADSSLYIIANGFIRNTSENINARNIDNVLNILKQNYKYILIDKDSSNADIDAEIVRLSDIVFFMIPQSISSFDKVQFALNHNYSCKNVKLILNKYEQKNQEKVNLIRSSLNKEIYWKIPKNFMATGSAANNFKTLKEVSPNLDIVNAYVQLAKQLVDRE